MVQTFNPDHVMLSQTATGEEITNAGFTQEFLSQLLTQSLALQLGTNVPMTSRMQRMSGAGELSNAYFVGEGEKIGTAKVESQDYILEARKLAVILPVTEEFLTYTWSRYFQEVVPVVVDKFAKELDGQIFLGTGGGGTNVFGNNIVQAATDAGNIVSGDLDFNNLIELEATTATDPTDLVGHRSLNVGLRGVVDGAGQYVFDRSTRTIDGLPYHDLKLSQGVQYDAGLIAGDFKNGIRYGVPNGNQLRIKLSDEATLSKVQNTNPDSGDVHLFEQDMLATRFIFEVAVAIPNNESFALLQPAVGV
ncbi:phage major capsid protein [Aerococcaceae bacterium DSM 111020]|nr:phage major capsid protein [Aerococcaceae bacterium DSM 111020]